MSLSIGQYFPLKLIFLVLLSSESGKFNNKRSIAIVISVSENVAQERRLFEINTKRDVVTIWGPHFS